MTMRRWIVLLGAALVLLGVGVGRSQAGNIHRLCDCYGAYYTYRYPYWSYPYVGCGPCGCRLFRSCLTTRLCWRHKVAKAEATPVQIPPTAEQMRGRGAAGVAAPGYSMPGPVPGSPSSTPIGPGPTPANPPAPPPY